MTTINSSELISTLTQNGFTVETQTFGTEPGDAQSSLHLNVSKPDMKTVEGHVEIGSDGIVAEAYVMLLDENGEVYKNRDMIVFLDEDDCTAVAPLAERFNQAMP